jgi:predicted dehydrogenase
MKKTNLPAPAAGSGLSRRNFLRRTTLAAGAAAMYFPYVGRVLGANDRINVACIGVLGKGDSDSADAAACGGNIVAICDVDTNHLATKKAQFDRNYPGKFSNLKTYQDYRKMLDEMGKSIDAVTVSIPDHNHGVAAIRAMKMGKHTFCQKPLVQTVNEARIVRKLAIDNKLATQMGNQGSALDALRRSVEVVQAGVIGDPVELHVWSNRPQWPQGLDRPPGEDPVPSNLDWDCWIGPAKMRPYKGKNPLSTDRNYPFTYHDFNWRGWFDFGTGSLGDMACHTVNMPFRAMKLGYPNVVELEVCSRMYPETFPLTSRIRFEFPAREGLPPAKFFWYDGNPRIAGNIQVLRPPLEQTLEIANQFGNNRFALPTSGALIVGTKGKLFSDDDYGTRFFVMMNGEKQYTPGAQHDAVKAVPITIPRAEPLPGGGGGRGGGGTTVHMNEWFTMMKDPSKPAYSHFEIAGYLAEVILLGCVALRVGEGKRMEWDGPNMMSPNLPEAVQFTKRENRAGWEA